MPKTEERTCTLAGAKQPAPKLCVSVCVQFVLTDYCTSNIREQFKPMSKSNQRQPTEEESSEASLTGLSSRTNSELSVKSEMF